MEPEMGRRSSAAPRGPLQHRRPLSTVAGELTPRHHIPPAIEDDGGGYTFAQLARPASWFLDLVAAMVNVVAVAMVSLSSTFSSLFAGSDGSARDPPQGSGRPPLRRLAFGMLGTVYVCLLLVAIFVLAVGIGVGLVSLWLEEPVMLSQPLHFDYTDAHPSGVVSLSYAPASGAAPKKRPIPLGHTFRVSLVLVLPESTFNLRLGVFQVAAEIISPDGDVLASSTQPCMLRFKSLPVRIMRTLLMGMPHVLGISCETQKIILGILEYKEKNPRTEAIKVRLKPRSGTYDIPQLYSSEILLNSRLPWGKNLAYNWKWTFYVWVSLYVYIILLTALLCCCKPFIFPRRLSDQGSAPIVAEKDLRSYREDGELSDESSADVKRRADRLRRKGKLPIMPRRSPIPPECSSSNVGGCETFEVMEDDDPGESSESSVGPRG